ncbi:unnamed protein product [Leptidea sinapis]|uniref:Cytochrome P450 n=1 Tax=Leptidea sinapis TaxID=189913 RepID=A0A5E4PPU8_9NEOP|nr:unnamed protein product [Leptidea sinapis]
MLQTTVYLPRALSATATNTAPSDLNDQIFNEKSNISENLYIIEINERILRRKLHHKKGIHLYFNVICNTISFYVGILDADQWIPERWLDHQRLPTNPHAYAPFSFGKRNCIGKAYAFMSLKVMFVHFFRGYKVFSNFANVKLKLDTVLRPHSGYEFSIQYRNK